MVIPVGFAQVNFIFQGPCVPRGAQVVIGVDNTANDYDPNDVAANIAPLWTANFTPLQTVDITLDKIKVKLGPNDTGAESFVGVGAVGELAQEAVPPQVTMLITKRTATGGRKNKGRINMPGLTEDDTAGSGTWDTAAITAWDNAADDFLAGLDSAGLPMVILHTDVTTPTPVVQLSVESRSATQRRRNRKVGGRRSTP